MPISPHIDILTSVVNLPTAPFVEGCVSAYIRDFVAKRRALKLQQDRFGNLLVRYVPPRPASSKGRPILFAAHMDHPGFIARDMTDARHVRADFKGWVQSRYFAGERIQFYSAGRWVPGKIVEVIPLKPTGPKARRAADSARSFGADAPPAAVIAQVRHAVEPGSPGMWGLPDARIRKGCLLARACDDVAGLAAILCALDVVCRKRISSPCIAFFTRAEEVGFAGALAAVADKTIPEEALVVAVECSKAVIGVQLGDGPVLRVGDKASIFSPAVTAYCQQAADELAKRDPEFRYQRKLMDGGTCESTAYCHYGYDATGICLPLGNYHNMDIECGRIGPEYIHMQDFENLVKWFVALADSPRKLVFDHQHPGLGQRLRNLLSQHHQMLLDTAASPANRQSRTR